MIFRNSILIRVAYKWAAGLFIALSLILFPLISQAQLTADWVYVDTLPGPSAYAFPRMSGLHIDHAGNVYVYNLGSVSGYISKYHADSTNAWTRAYEGSHGNSWEEGFAADSLGNSYFGDDISANWSHPAYFRVISYDSDGQLRNDWAYEIYTSEQYYYEDYRHGFRGIVADNEGYAYVAGWYGCNFDYRDCTWQATLLVFDSLGGVIEERFSTPLNSGSALAEIAVGGWAIRLGFGWL